MGHRAKHLRRNWTPERVKAAHTGRGPATTKATTGRAQTEKRAAKAHIELPVVAFLRMARR